MTFITLLLLYHECMAVWELTASKSVLPNIDMLNISPIEKMEKTEPVVQWFGPENRGVHRDCLSGKQPSLYCNRD